MTPPMIFSVTMVKNEVDIIESFIRYNLNIVDGMIILDNGSTDSTLKILEDLQKEGLPLHIFQETDIKYQQAKKTNKLILKAFNDFEADIVVPLDADEFIISSKGGNPRQIIEKINKSSYYLVKWKTYVPDLEMDKNEKFIPSRLTFARGDNFETLHKVILPKELVQKYSVKVKMGSHNLIYDHEYEDLINPFYEPGLRIAHFPIRSKEQAITKISVGWINVLTEPDRTKLQSWHWQKIFNKIKEANDLEDADLMKFAKEFDIMDPPREIKIKKDPIDLSFCKNINLKYSNYKISYLSEILKISERISENFLAYQNEARAEKNRLKNEIHQKDLEKKNLERLIEKYENSASWRITAPIRKISLTIKNLFN